VNPTEPVRLREGMRVRLNPRQRADIFDLALAGRTAEVERVEHRTDGRTCAVVRLENDQAFDMGPMGQLGHRFFFSSEELEVLDADPPAGRVLVASVCPPELSAVEQFGRRVIDRLQTEQLPVQFADFSIRVSDFCKVVVDFDRAVVVLPDGQVSSGKSLSVLHARPDEIDWESTFGTRLPARTDPIRCKSLSLVRFAGHSAEEPEDVIVVAEALKSAVEGPVESDRSAVDQFVGD